MTTKAAAKAAQDKEDVKAWEEVAGILDKLSGLGVEIEGQRFKMARDLTIEQELWVDSYLVESGISEAAEGFDAGKHNLKKSTLNLIFQTYRNGTIWQIMAGLLLPVGKEWSPEVAAETVGFLKKVKDAKSRDVIKSSYVGVILSFFILGSPSLRTLITSLQRSDVSLSPKHPAKRSASRRS